MNPKPVRSRAGRLGFLEKLVLKLVLSVLPLLAPSVILSGKNLLAQTQATRTTEPVPQQNTAVLPSRRTTAQTDSASAQRWPVPEATIVRPALIWPFGQPPNPAKVRLDSRGLQIEATNSSLNQILRQVAAYTGAKLEGLTVDQPVFGSYGPGPISEVLSKLLDGSGYNVLMISSHDAGAPLEIVLSVRLHASPPTAASKLNRGNLAPLEPERQPNPSEAANSQSNQNPFDVGGPPHDPLQFMQEILDRQHQIDLQQDHQDNKK
jgi:hypothetical protein